MTHNGRRWRHRLGWLGVGLVVALLAWWLVRATGNRDPSGLASDDAPPPAAAAPGVPAAGESGAPAGAAEATTAAPDPASATTAAEELAGDRLPVQATLEVRWETTPSGERERWRLVRLSAEPERLARVVEQVRWEAASGRWWITRQDVMRADCVVVMVPRGATRDAVVERLRTAGFAPADGSAGDAAIVVRLAEADLDAVPKALAALAGAVPDLAVEPDYLYFPTQTAPDDYDGRVQWGLEAIDAPAAWTLTTGSADVVVAIIDTGIDLTHPDLAANLWVNPGEVPGNGLDDDGNGFIDDVNGWDFVDNNNTVADENNHGTHVAGIIGAVGNNGTGETGVAWNVRLMPLRVGGLTFDNASTLNALAYANTMRERGVNVVVVNGSFGGDTFSLNFRGELARARDNNIVFVAAAGNDAADNDVTPFYPANYDVENVIAVAAMHQGGGLSSFSNFGAATVDLAAPGTEIRSTVRNGLYGYLDGTSMAAPHVSGAVALVAAHEPGLSATQLRARILASTEPVPALAGRVATGGRLDVLRAVAPTIARPRVAITAPAADIVALDRTGLGVSFTAAPVADAVTGQVPLIDQYSWEVVEGDAAAVLFSTTDGAATTACFQHPGVYRVCVRATAGALTETAAVTVLVRLTQYAGPGLRASWQFDEGGGATALDASLDGRDGTLENGASRAAGIYYQGIALDGGTSRVRFAAPTLPAVSIAGWVRAASPGNSVFPRVLHMRSGLLFLGYDTASGAPDGNARNLKFALDDGLDGRVFHTPPGSMTTGAWHHVVATFDGTAPGNLPRLYVDGSSLVVGVQDGAAATPTVAAGAGFIGDRGDGQRAWDGVIDDLRLYDRELTPGEIGVLAHGPTLRALQNGAFFETPGADPQAIALTFQPQASQLGPVTIAQADWSSLDGALTFTQPGASGAVALAAASGSCVVRLDLTTTDRVCVVRTLPVTFNLSPVATAGLYTGTVSDGGVFTLQVTADGRATFVGGGGAGRFDDGVAVTPFGRFAPQDDDLPGVFDGTIDLAGNVTGSLAGGSITYTGSRVATVAADAAHDGTYRGWLLDTGIAVDALVAGGRVTLAVREAGASSSAAASYSGDDGSFRADLTTGAVYAGRVGEGRIDCAITLPGHVERQAVLFRSGDRPAHGLVNISIRGPTRRDDAIVIGGFVLEGAGTLPVLVRGIGPGLDQFQLQGLLAHPRLRLFDGGRAQLLENVGWEADGPAVAAQLRDAFARTGAFALDPGSLDAAMLADLPAGAYTAQVTGADGGTGLTLVEAYDARGGGETARIVNLSARGPVGTNDELLIGGFVVSGDAPSLVLVRAVGPGLAGYDVPGTLAAPVLTVLRGNTPVATSQAWAAGGARLPLEQAAAQTGAFSLESTSNDAAVLLYLDPGLYTAQVRGAGDTTGNALVEVYLVPDE